MSEYTLEELTEIGKIVVASGFFPECNTLAKAMAKILIGREYGLTPMSSVMNVFIQKGKPGLAANLLAYSLKRSGQYDYKVLELTPTVCKIEFLRRVSAPTGLFGQAMGEDKWASVGISVFTIEDAQRANLTTIWDKDTSSRKPNPTWANFPRNLLFARAITNGQKWYAPDVSQLGFYTPEELGGPEAEFDAQDAPKLADIIRQTAGQNPPPDMAPHPDLDTEMQQAPTRPGDKANPFRLGDQSAPDRTPPPPPHEGDWTPDDFRQAPAAPAAPAPSHPALAEHAPDKDILWPDGDGAVSLSAPPVQAEAPAPALRPTPAPEPGGKRKLMAIKSPRWQELLKWAVEQKYYTGQTDSNGSRMRNVLTTAGWVEFNGTDAEIARAKVVLAGHYQAKEAGNAKTQ